MPGGFAPRFAVEAGFLILLGVGAGYANLRPIVIVALLAGGWALVSLFELAVWRAQARPAVVPLPPPPVAEPEPEPGPVVEEAPEPAEEDYPLRADAGQAPSEEVEAYTRVIGVSGEDDPPREDAE
jgi:hypothetical protein